MFSQRGVHLVSGKADQFLNWKTVLRRNSFVISGKTKSEQPRRASALAAQLISDISYHASTSNMPASADAHPDELVTDKRRRYSGQPSQSLLLGPRLYDADTNVEVAMESKQLDLEPDIRVIRALVSVLLQFPPVQWTNIAKLLLKGWPW